MKCLLTLTLVAVVVSVAAYAQEPKTQTRDAAAWFDMESCEICKNFSKVDGMMERVKWETHVIPDGFLSISVIPEDLKKPMAIAKKGMKESIAKLESGEKINCCGYCQSMGALLQAGAKTKEISTVGGDIMLVTSSDPVVVEKIQAHAKRSNVEHEKMMEHMKMHKENPTKQKGD